MDQLNRLEQQSQDWLISIGLMVVAVVLALVAHRLVFAVADRATRRTTLTLDEALVGHVRQPARLMAPLVAVLLVGPLLRMPPDAREPLLHFAGLALVAAAAWGVISLTWIADDLVLARYDLEGRDNLAARTVLTQISIMRRVVVIVVVLVTLAIMLLTFPGAEGLGASLLASVGVAGLVVGMAARPVLSNLLAGMQIALTQPIRLDDVVVIEGEWGRIEEITTTYVVVRTWDLRRLVVPLSRVIEQPFENWTRRTANMIGTVTIHADYAVPVDDVRAELHRILKASALWDGQAWGLQVTETTERTIALRALMSAADSGALWDLRCLVRERLVAYLKSRHPSALPRLRTAAGRSVARAT
jgi:small-conductance mechanosensitive channel